MQKGKWLSEEALQVAEKRRDAKGKGEKESQSYLNAESDFIFWGSKITAPFRYDLNQIPYNYTVEVKNRFKGLDQIDRVPGELWMELHNLQETVIKTIPKKKEMQQGKMIV